MCYDRQRDEILDRLYGIKGSVESIRLYLKHIYAMKHFSFGTWSSRQHVIAAVSAGGKTGFAECILSVNEPKASLKPWKKLLEDLAGLHVGDALKALREHQDIWPEQLIEMTEMALIDLCGKISGCPANVLLGLTEGTPVCSVHVILSDNLEEVEESARWAKSQGKNQFIKVKLFGKTELDCQVIRTVRSVCPAEETFLIGDVNCGYRPEGEVNSLAQIEEQMKHLHQAGLDACEDPAFLSRDEWVELQKSVSPLELIPDYPLRPSRCSVKEICAGMGKIYNIHPDSAGSIVDAVVLAGRIRQLGAGLMIGDDSLAGPSASIWQQLAYGLEARWVEAAEKRKESDFFYRCVRSLATDSSHNPVKISLKDGFGIDLDEEKLAEETDLFEEILPAKRRGQ
ncbi:MAG: hypothetical protein HFG65_11285 [Hungatella sp.]|nr:hypothetical protein [Hungatella sp.]